MGSGFFVSLRQRKRTRFCSFYRAGRIKGGLPCGGRKGVARSEPSLLSPLTELERRGATSGSITEGHEVIGFVPAAGGFRSLRHSAQVGARPGAAWPQYGHAAPRAPRRFLCPAFFGSGRQRKRAGFCSFWPGSKRRRMGTTRKCPGSLASCRGIISSKTALSDHRACERSESSGIPDPTRWPRSP